VIEVVVDACWSRGSSRSKTWTLSLGVAVQGAGLADESSCACVTASHAFLT
jgi:hypothetical protein